MSGNVEKMMGTKVLGRRGIRKRTGKYNRIFYLHNEYQLCNICLFMAYSGLQDTWVNVICFQFF